MDTVSDHHEPSWNVMVSTSHDDADEIITCPAWADEPQQMAWNGGALRVWDHESQNVVALNLFHTLTLRDFLRITSDWRTLGLRIGNVSFEHRRKNTPNPPPPLQTIPEPIFALLHGGRLENFRSYLSTPMILTPDQAQQVLDAIEAKEVLLISDMDTFWKQITPAIAHIHNRALRKSLTKSNE